METPKISVIVPVYRTEPYLRRCLDSIGRQTYRNLEIILVDDGSPDNCGRICDEYAEQDDRILVIHKENGGTASARNTGLERASGEWIGFVDSDDYIEPDMYEYLLDLVFRNNADIVQCGAILEEGSGKSEVRYVPKQEMCVDIDSIARAWHCFSNEDWCKIYQKSILNKIRFDCRYVIGEDLLFNLEALCKAKKIVFGEQAKYHYMQIESSICHAPPSEASLVSIRNMLLHAEVVFSEQKEISRWCYEQRLRNNLDMSSRIIRYRLEDNQSALVRELRGELRELIQRGFAGVTFSSMEKLKSMLIGFAWNIYKLSIVVYKGIERYER